LFAETDKQVEERPSITYADVGGCKEQIEKLREVVELPLLEVRLSLPKSVLS
jgi:26S proteasome regulatory subunit T1